ncbi:hypothetical protein J31TS4_29240 [Paenibacillus sp. J31TS4]|uniref:vWA domain-containing protein n=1 Tax=Paenibacillus sp. J31TS4 TaxID=2807195 RepID=UPI001B2190B3|nr:VWA domain-containing protein [Paenibacillus sp. J31TS4]GIP39644.1 hypothetical protein J31TS4_29240 [Paenibacillus sp. J31TS4]
MGFDSAASWWFALALPAIAAMYLLKKTYDRRTVPSTLLWERALQDSEANRPWQRLRRRLLLLLQLLAAALLVLALTEPYAWLPRSAGAQVVILLDNSASMQAATARAEETAGSGPGRTSPAAAQAEKGGPTRLEAAKADLLQWVRKEAKHSRFTVIAFGEGGPESVLSGGTAGELEAAVGSVRPFYGRAAYEEAVSLAGAIAREEKEAELRLYTDGQWPEPAGWPEGGIPYTVVRAEEKRTDNISVVQFGVRSGTSGRSAAGTASVKNWSGREMELDVSVYADSRLAYQRKETVKAGEQKTLAIGSLPEAQVYRLALTADDAIREDNTAHAFASGAQTSRALLAGEGNLFLEKALALAGVEVVKATKGETGYVLPDSEVDWIVLDSVAEAEFRSPEWQTALAGKPVWYIHTGIEGPEEPVPAGIYTVAEHPVTRYIRLQDAHIASVLTGRVPLWARPLVRAESRPLIMAGEENGRPRLLFAFDLRRSDLPLRPEFPVLVQNAAEWLGAAKPGQLGTALASSAKEIPLSALAADAKWVNTDTGEEKPAHRTAGQIQVSQTVPAVPGLYRFVELDQQGKEIRNRLLAVGMDGRESNLSKAGRAAASDRPVTGADREPDLAAGTASRTADGRSAVPLMMAAAALVLLAVLAEGEVYRRGHSL